jgi:hypothetical protein
MWVNCWFLPGACRRTLVRREVVDEGKEPAPQQQRVVREEDGMPTYMVERVLPRATLAEVAALRRAVEEACRAFAAEGRPVRYVRSTFTPGDSRCLCLFEAPTAALVQAVNEAAQIPFNRIVLAVDLGPDGSTGRPSE